MGKKIKNKYLDIKSRMDKDTDEKTSTLKRFNKEDYEDDVK